MATIINADTSDGLKLTSDTSGEIALQSAGVTQAKITASGLQNASGVAITAQSGKNLIINGNMQIAQRGTSATGVTSSGYRTCDRWNHVMSSLGTYTISQDTDVPTGQGFGHSLKIACTTADASPAAADYHFMQHRMEGQNLQHLKKGTSNAESLTLSFWVKCNQTGTLRANLRDVDNSRYIGGSYTINTADTWEKKTITFTGDTSGVLDNDVNQSLTPEFWFDSGTDYSSGSIVTSWETMTSANRNAGTTINLADSVSNYINITGVQLETGTVATEFEHLQYGQQLAMCQRYYEKSYPIEVAPGTANYMGPSAVSARTTSSGYCFYTVPYIVSKRATPAISLWSFNGTVNQLGSFDSGTNLGAASAIRITIYSFLLCNNSGGNIADGSPITINFSASSEL